MLGGMEERPPPTGDWLERVVLLARRELGAESVEVGPAAEVAADDPKVMTITLADGRRVVVRFAEPVESKDAVQRRLEMLVSTFSEIMEAPPDSKGDVPRPSVAEALDEELRALAARAMAKDAAVIDAQSPVIWGATSGGARRDPRGQEDELRLLSRRELIDEIERSAPANEDAGETPPSATERVVDAVRALPQVASLRRGAHLHHLGREGDVGYLARSFAGIYVLVLLFEGGFDELRAERAVTDSLRRIERLVLALPPFDPSPAPVAGVISLRARRRR